MLSFSDKLLAWFDQHGRKHLPWQQAINPYRVWISEIMLQQTQVKTVIPYYERFMQHFPDIQALANAPQDEVLHLWTGLGYYARARNMHKAAQMIMNDFGGKFPTSLDEITSLPGIGRSTAGAILSIAFKQRAAILDGNVKRVLARYYAIKEWTGKTDVVKSLWNIAEKLTPTERVADYTQAIMDLGATVCTRSKPICNFCPLKHECLAHIKGLTHLLPTPKPKKTIPTRNAIFLILKNKSSVLLEQRPPSGIWGGLWCLPEYTDEIITDDYILTTFGCRITSQKTLTAFRHTFSHFHLDITPILIEVDPVAMQDNSQLTWYDTNTPPKLGLAAPVKKLLECLKQYTVKN